MTTGTRRHNNFSSKTIVWDEAKNEWLMRMRGVSFEVVKAIFEAEKILDYFDHPKQWKYPGQQIAVIEINGYAYTIPFLETDTELILKTIIPSRKATAKYLKEKNTDETNLSGQRRTRNS